MQIAILKIIVDLSNILSLLIMPLIFEGRWISPFTLIAKFYKSDEMIPVFFISIIILVGTLSIIDGLYEIFKYSKTRKVLNKWEN